MFIYQPLLLCISLIQYALTEVTNPIATVGWNFLFTTLYIYCFSLLFKNSGTYDLYWSTAPIVIAYFWFENPIEATDDIRPLVVFALVCFWGLRLSYNWIRQWGGIGHEDWRYVDQRTQVGKWASSLTPLEYTSLTRHFSFSWLPVFICIHWQR